MLKKSEKMSRVAKLIDREQQQASRRISQLREALQNSERQLETLRDYRQVYHAAEQRPEQANATLTRPSQFRNYSAFLGQLNQAVRQQELQVDQARQEFDAQVRHWRAAKSRTRAVERVAERHAGRERRESRRHEQTLADELILRRFFEPVV